jgi:tRNA modification GTPase
MIVPSSRLKHISSLRWTKFYSSTSQPTIYALSTHPGRAAIAIIRVSGPKSLDVYRKLSRKTTIPRPRQAFITTLYEIGGKGPLDEALALYFRAPSSYTGDDLIEFHVHGGPAVVQGVLSAIRSLNNSSVNDANDANDAIRYAEPGEFTRRAFYNGRMDLTQVEGVRDIIDAETEYQRKLAMVSASGKSRQLYETWRTKLVESMATLTALIDFSDDNLDINQTSKILFERVTEDVTQLLGDIRNHIFQSTRAEIVKSGIRMNFLGPPNAGKSSLLNKLVQREAAIVSEVPGTTRDVLEVAMDIGGYKVVLGDTAGIRAERDVGTDASSKIELEGIRRARERFQIGDVLLVVLPLDQLNMFPQDIIEELKKHSGQKTIVALNKSDLVSHQDLVHIQTNYSKQLDIPLENVLPISCKTEAGVSDLVGSIKSACEEIAGQSTTQENASSASARILSLLEIDIIPSLQNYLGKYSTF